MLPMLTAAVRPTTSRLWLLFIGLLAAFAFALASPPTEATPILIAAAVPIAAVVLIGTIGYAYRDVLVATKARTLLLILASAAIATVTFQLPALAQAAESGVVRPTESTVITIDAAVLSFAIGSVLPLLTALAAKLNASSAVKATVNLVLSIAGGVLAAFVANSGSLTPIEIGAAAIAVFLGSSTTYYSVWRPTGATAAVAGATPERGFG